MLRDVSFDWRFLFGGLDGRIGPAAWRCGAIALALTSFGLHHGLVALVATDGTPGRLLGLALFVGLLYPFVALSAKRFQDRGKPGEYALLLAGPSAVHAALAANGLLADAIWLENLFGMVILACASWFVLELGFGASRPERVAAPREAD
jgi:uncharacterized membrane protein YhaH (DUF805 family)